MNDEAFFRDREHKDRAWSTMNTGHQMVMIKVDGDLRM